MGLFSTLRGQTTAVNPAGAPPPPPPVMPVVAPQYADARPRKTMTFPTHADPARDASRITARIVRSFGTGWNVEATSRLADGRLLVTAVEGVPAPHPDSQTLQLGPAVKPTDGERLAALVERDGRTLVSFDPYRRVAVTAALDDRQRRIRSVVAGHLGLRMWEVDVVVTGAVEADGTTRTDSVVITGFPPFSTSQKRLNAFTELLALIPGAGDWWEIIDEPQSNRVTLKHRVKPELPTFVDGTSILPDVVRAGDWDRLPFGIDPNGVETVIDLKLGPHSLVIGPTGTGKSVTLRALVSSALARGHEVLLCDAIKGGTDFSSLRPMCSAWASTREQINALLEVAYEELQRRREIIISHGAESWADLPADLRRREHIVPWLILIDEYVSTVVSITPPKGLDKAHPIATRIAEANLIKAQIGFLVGNLAREARFAGIHLALGAQRPDAAILGGEMRSNLTSNVLCCKPQTLPNPDTMRMIFAAEEVAAATGVVTSLNQGKERGLAVISADGGDIVGTRVGYAKSEALAAHLRHIGVPDGRPVPGYDADAISVATEFSVKEAEIADFSIIEEAAEPIVIETELNDFEFSLDDLNEPFPNARSGPSLMTFALPEEEEQIPPEIDHDDVEPVMTFDLDEGAPAVGGPDDGADLDLNDYEVGGVDAELRAIVNELGGAS